MVSIRRADRCLVEADNGFPLRAGGHVSIRRADRCLVEGHPIVIRARIYICFNPPCGSLFG